MALSPEALKFPPGALSNVPSPLSPTPYRKPAKLATPPPGYKAPLVILKPVEPGVSQNSKKYISTAFSRLQRWYTVTVVLLKNWKVQVPDRCHLPVPIPDWGLHDLRAWVKSHHPSSFPVGVGAGRGKVLGKQNLTLPRLLPSRSWRTPAVTAALLEGQRISQDLSPGPHLQCEGHTRPQTRSPRDLSPSLAPLRMWWLPGAVAHACKTPPQGPRGPLPHAGVHPWSPLQRGLPTGRLQPSLLCHGPDPLTPSWKWV